MMTAASMIHNRKLSLSWPEDLKWTSFNGTCAGVQIFIPENSSQSLEKALLARLHPEEIRLASRMPKRRALEWIGGRLAVREAMKSHPPGHHGPVLATRRGAPLIPGGLPVSISHKSNKTEVTAVALVAGIDQGHVGIDLETIDEPREGVAPLVLTQRELKKVENLSPAQRWLQILLHFSLKEAVYKAIDPFVQRYVDYQEASLDPCPDGSAEIIWHTTGLKTLMVEALWTTRGKYILTSAKMMNISSSKVYKKDLRTIDYFYRGKELV